MSFGDILLLIVAFVAAVGAIAGIGLFLHAENCRGAWVAPSIIPLLALGIAVSSLLSGRNLTRFGFETALNDEAFGSAAWLLRILTYVVLGICVARLVGQAYRRRELEPADGALLFGAISAYYIGNNVLPSFLGTHPTFIHNLLYPIIPCAAVFVSRREPLTPIISAAKVALMGMMIASLIVAVFQPQLAVQPYTTGWVPWLYIRLWGVGSNANSIGPLALVYLLLEYMQPWQRRDLRWFAVSAATLVFILAQSKTVWGAALLALPLLAWYRQSRSTKRIVTSGVVAGICALILVSGSAVFLMGSSSLWEQIAYTQAGSDISTLTGRGRIWQVAIAEWKRNILFGYGPEIWGARFRWQIGMPFAFSAHNQFLQSLSGAGVVGVITLAGYLVVLGRMAFRVADATRGVSVVLFFIIVIRCMTETPLTLGTLFNGDFLTQLLLFQLVLRKPIGRESDISCKVPIILRTA
ncbi:O-antigen ligase [Geobacter sp.]|uniref:O-antigen ligase family protein n=1 Tax=Geobacter sp. TaxID=46610 RepID=UPI00260EB12C|nr:O-antigen ligase family protein [Geobacter sp.]